MKGGKRSWMAIVASVIIVVAVVLAVVHFYVSADSQAISVENSQLNVTYSAHFKNINSSDPYLFSTNASRAVVSEANHVSYVFSLFFQNGEIFYMTGMYPNESFLLITFNLVTIGLFTTNLHPNSMTLLYNGQGLKNQSLFSLQAETPPRQASNVSTNNTWTLNNVNGPNEANATLSLLNENTSLQAYNFSTSISMELYIYTWYPNSTHTFSFSAQVNGLSKPVVASISMSIVELGS